MGLNRDAILGAEDRKIEPFDVPEWGGQVYLAPLMAADRDAFEQSVSIDGKNVNLKNVRARLLCAAIVDENGERIFKEADAEVLGKKSGAVIGRIYERVQELNGLTKKDIEELEGN